MNIFNKSFGNISIEDIKLLIDSNELENKYLEYKQELPKNDDKSKHELCADVSSFANSAGGYIIYGVKEPENIENIYELVGLDSIDADKEILRISQIFQYHIKERINFDIKPIQIDNVKCIIIIHIPKSWLAPHAVKFSDNLKFYSRHSNGKYLLDINEIRTSFLLSDTIGQKAKNFRMERISQIASDEVPVPFIKDTPKIILHIVPYISFDINIFNNMKDMREYVEKYLIPIYTENKQINYNLEGIYSYDNCNGVIRTYTQLFRNGIIEAVDTYYLNNDQKILNKSYEKEILSILPNYFNFYKSVGIQAPYFLMLTLTGLCDYNLMSENEIYRYHYHKHFISLSRDILILPEIIVEDLNIEPEIIIKPIFDMVWNAFGCSHSLNYNDKNEWVGFENR